MHVWCGPDGAVPPLQQTMQHSELRQAELAAGPAEPRLPAAGPRCCSLAAIPSLLPYAVGDALVGQVVDFLGRPYPLQHQPAASSSGNGGGGSSSIQPHPEAEGGAGAAPAPIGADALLPLLNGQPDMDSREQINEALLTGVRVSSAQGRDSGLQAGALQGRTARRGVRLIASPGAVAA